MTTESLRTGRNAGRAFARLAPLLALCLWASPVGAQYRFDHWTADTGLPQNSVRDIVQTRDGYLWLTTFDGLVRFDGVRFTVFNKSNSPGLPGNRFVSLFEDRSGDLWATLETGEVVRRHRGRFTAFPAPERYAASFPFLLADDGQGNAAAYSVQLLTDEAVGASASAVGRARRWSGETLERAEDLDFTFPLPPDLVKDPSAILWLRLLGDEFWLGTARDLVRIRRDGSSRVYSESNGLPGRLPALVPGHEQGLRVVTRDAGGRLWLTDLASMRSELMSQQSPGELVIRGGLADREGNYWFGIYDNGMVRARRQPVTPLVEAQGGRLGEVYPLVETRDGALWIGTAADGLIRLKDGVSTRWATPKDQGIGPFAQYVSSLYEDRDGRLHSGGFWRMENGKLVAEPWARALVVAGARSVWAMYEDPAGAFWLGTDAGVWRARDGALEHFTTADGLAGDDTKVIVGDGKVGLWLGSTGGLTHYADGRFTAWTEKDGLPGDTVRALEQDADGVLWIGTYDSGLGRFKDGRFTRYTTRDGLFDNGVFRILEDDDGWFWMSCNRGVYRVRKRELNAFADGTAKAVTCLAFNRNDGMPSAECNGGRWPAGIKGRDGRLWFPTMGGVAMIDPATITASTLPPPVVIEGMRVDNEAVADEAWDAAIGAAGPPSAIEVMPGRDSFEIAYTALSFVNSENLRFKYKLDGADHDWVDAGTRRTAYYSHVSPGEYTFRVIAANADGVWNEAGASVRVTVVPPFWRTWWFLALAALGAAAAVVVAWKFRVAQLRRAQSAQEAFARRLIASQESERKRIAGELHDSLGQSLVIIRNWAVLGAGQLEKSAPAREELDEIDAIASRAIGEVREIAYNLGPYHLERLGFENSIRDMVKRVARVSAIAITTELDSPGGALSRESEMGLYRVAQEALNNVVKHSGATEALVTLEREAAGVRLAVADNGRGFDTHAAAQPDHPGRSGFGLNGMAERVRLLGGTLTVRSAPGHGTTVETLLPGAPEGANAAGR